MRIEFIEINPKSTENTNSARTFGFALTDILQVSLVGGECSIKFGRRRKVLIFGVYFSPR